MGIQQAIEEYRTLHCGRLMVVGLAASHQSFQAVGGRFAEGVVSLSRRVVDKPKYRGEWSAHNEGVYDDVLLKELQEESKCGES